jgi:hypothetical protein
MIFVICPQLVLREYPRKNSAETKKKENRLM